MGFDWSTIVKQGVSDTLNTVASPMAGYAEGLTGKSAGFKPQIQGAIPGKDALSGVVGQVGQSGEGMQSVMPIIEKLSGMVKSDENCKENISRSSYSDMRSMVGQLRGKK